MPWPTQPLWTSSGDAGSCKINLPYPPEAPGTLPTVIHDLSGLEKSEYILATRLVTARLKPRETARGTRTTAKETLRRAGSLRSRSNFMRYFLTLAAAASLLAACHNRSEDEVGAAPDRGDTTAVTATDTTAAAANDTTAMTPTDTTTTGYSADSAATPAPGDSAMVNQADTTSGAYSDTTSAAPMDTTSAQPMDSTKQ